MPGRFKKVRVKLYTKMNFQSFWTLPKISKLSPAKRHFFDEKFGSKLQIKKGLLFAVGVSKVFSLFFLHWEYQTHSQNLDFTKFLSVMHFHTIEKDPVQISSKPSLMVKCRSFLHILKTRKRNY